MKMSNELWETIKNYYKKAFGIDKNLVDLMASYDIALLCASGASNKRISSFVRGFSGVEITEEEVAKELYNVLGFSGWMEDLDINPYLEYDDSLDEDDFREALIEKYGHDIPINMVGRMYEACVKCFLMEKKLESEWI